MQSLKLVEKNNCKVPYLIGDELGYGADGQCFSIKDDPNKVIKISVLYEWTVNYSPTATSIVANNANLTYQNISDVLDWLVVNSTPTYAKVYEHKLLGEFIREKWNGSSFEEQKYILHYYIMEKLYEISDDESKVFTSIFWQEKIETPRKLKKILKGLSLGLDFDAEKVIFFCENFRKTPIIHEDLHVGNIMKDKLGNFKLIDFDMSLLSIGDYNEKRKQSII